MMSLAVDSASSTSNQSSAAQVATDNTSNERKVSSAASGTVGNSSPTTTATPSTTSTDGRDSLAGEKLFAASMRKDAIQVAALNPGGMASSTATANPATPASPAATPSGPETFNADNKVPKFVWPPAGKMGPDATPQQASDFIRAQEMGFGDTRNVQSQLFVQALNDHKGDAAWTQQFFRSLGSSKTAEIINNTVTTGNFQYASAANRESSLATVRNALSGLAQNPQLFNQADMNALVGKMADKEFNPWVGSEIFSKSSGTVKDLFVTAAAGKASDPNASGGSINTMAAAATNTLASMSYDHQLQEMNQLNKTGTLDGLIQKAMAGPRDLPTFSSLNDALQKWTPVDRQPFSQVDGLATNVAYASYTDGWAGPPPISSKDLESLQTNVFNSVAQSLSNKQAEDNFRSSDMFRNSMATLFTDHFDSIVNSGLGSNGAGFDTQRFQPGMEKFFQDVLFTNKPDFASKQVGAFLGSKLGAYGQGLTDTSTNAEQNFRNQFGRSRMDGAAVAGGMLGMLTDAIKSHNDELKANAEARAGAIKLVLDIGIGFIPGVGKAVAGQVESAVAKKILETTLGKIQDSVVDQIKTGALDKAKQMLLDQFKNKDPQDAVIGLFNGLNQTIPNGDNPGEPNFLTQFQSSYNTIINSPNRVTR